MVNLFLALRKRCGRLFVLGVVGRDGGFAKWIGDSMVVISTVDDDFVMPNTEAFDAVV